MRGFGSAQSAGHGRNDREKANRSVTPFFDAGRGQLIPFMEARNVPGFLRTGINRGLGMPNALYHFAFEAALVRSANS